MLIGIDGNEANIIHRVGVNQFAFALLWAMHDLPAGHQFVIYLKAPPLSDLPPAGSNWQYRVIPWPKLWTQTRLPFDLFTHFPRPAVFFTPSHYAPRLAPMPVVVSIMDLGFLSSQKQFTAKDFNQLKRWTAYSVRLARQIIAISEFTKQDIVRYYHRLPADITVAYPAYDRRAFKPAAGRSLPAKSAPPGKYFLFLGSLKPSKNIEGLISAYAAFRSAGGRDLPKLVIVGKKAWLYDRIFARVGDLGLTDEVIFTGFVPDAEVPGWLAGASALVMPSFFEGFGIPVLEAMACGTPVIVSRAASLPEVAGEAGIYVDPADIGSIVAGLKLAVGRNRAKYVAAGIKQAGKFSWSQTARVVIKVLESCTINPAV